MRRRAFLYRSAAIVVAPLAAEAQRTKVPKVGYLSAGSATSAHTPAFLAGLRELGYVEGQNVAVEPRYAEERLERRPELASDLLTRQPALLARADQVIE
jgi:hypothetical protein